MKTLTRWTSGIVASLERITSQIENHEALVNTSIREMSEAAARAKIQLKRVKEDGKRLRKKLAELHDTEEIWAERARKVADQDREKALECLRRRKRFQREISDLEEQQRIHVSLESQLSADLARVNEKLGGLRRKRNVLRTRQSSAEALSASGTTDSELFSELDDIFDRWEIRVTQVEQVGEISVEADDMFESEFVSKEEMEELEAELSQLLAQEESHCLG